MKNIRNIRTIYLDLLAALTITLLVAGCSESSTDPPVNNNPADTLDTTDTTGTLDTLDTLDTVNMNPPAPPTGLQAVSLDGGVGLLWTSSDTAGVAYRVTVSDGMTSEAYENIEDERLRVEGLDNGTVYSFEVVAVRGNKESDPISIPWAPANHYDRDLKIFTPLRLYSRFSFVGGGGIVVDQSGAYNASVGPGSPDLSAIQLMAEISADGFTIGVPKSFTNFPQVASFRDDVQISDTYVELDSTLGLDGWYMSRSLEALFLSQGTGQFTVTGQWSGGKGMGFALRWGTFPFFRYARVFVVPGDDGNPVQVDEEENQFLELRISFQPSLQIPYAKK